MRLLAIVLSFGLALAVKAQDSPAPSPKSPNSKALPEVPADHIYDDARLLDDSSRAALVEIIQKLKTQWNVDLYVAAYTILREDIDEHARQLRVAWADNDRGVVMLYRRGSQQLTFSATSESERFIPTSDLYSIYNDAVRAALTTESPRERIVVAAQALSDGLAKDLATRDPKRRVLTAEVAKLIAGLVMIVLLIGGCAYAIHRKLSRRSEERDTAVTFPDLVVGSRLGASFGGGTVAELEFEKAPVSADLRPQTGAPTVR